MRIVAVVAISGRNASQDKKQIRTINRATPNTVRTTPTWSEIRARQTPAARESGALRRRCATGAGGTGGNRAGGCGRRASLSPGSCGVRNRDSERPGTSAAAGAGPSPGIRADRRPPEQSGELAEVLGHGVETLAEFGLVGGASRLGAQPGQGLADEMPLVDELPGQPDPLEQLLARGQPAPRGAGEARVSTSWASGSTAAARTSTFGGGPAGAGGATATTRRTGGAASVCQSVWVCTTAWEGRISTTEVSSAATAEAVIVGTATGSIRSVVISLSRRRELVTAAVRIWVSASAAGNWES